MLNKYKEYIMQININQYGNRQAFGAKLKFNSLALRNLFARELSGSFDSVSSRIVENKSGHLRENIQKFKNLYPDDVIEVTLRDTNYSDKDMDVFNPKTMHIKSFTAVDRGGIVSNAFGKMFEFLVGNESKAFWTDKTAKDLFVK